MKRLLLAFFVTLLSLASLASAADAPLRVFIRSGPKSHGPGQHDHPRFLREWTQLLNERGARATGGDTFPTAAQLAETDVLIIHAQEGGNIPDATDRANLEAFLKRGGGIVVLHAAAVSRDPEWYKTIIGGSWRHGTTKWLEAPMHVYFSDRSHPITKGASNWAMDDEIYYDMDLRADIHALATAPTPKKKGDGFEAQTQLWTYEKPGAQRAFVFIPGHTYVNFSRPDVKLLLLRGIAWAGRQTPSQQLEQTALLQICVFPGVPVTPPEKK